MSGQFRWMPWPVAALVFLAGGVVFLVFGSWLWRMASGNGWLVGQLDVALNGDEHGEGIERLRAGRPGP